MTDINAFAAKSAGSALEAWSYTPRTLGADDVRIEISHCGICHSDIHRIDNGWKNSPTSYPFVGGHEIVGKVVAKGANVEQFALGDRVGAGPQAGCCGTCKKCVGGEENYCPKKFYTYNSKELSEFEFYFVFVIVISTTWFWKVVFFLVV
jgi:D-arabinose 1-dehydrogenase-like Zn-dependent alcohol dehydrogenase